MLSDMKAKVRHKYRALQEGARVNLHKQDGVGDVMQKITAKNIRAAAKDAGIHNRSVVDGVVIALTKHPETILNSKFWKDIGAGSASFLLHGKFNTDYKAPKIGGAISRKASSLERIGGTLGTGVYKAGRNLHRAEKWLNIDSPDDRREQDASGGGRYSQGSAFSRYRRDTVDACAKKRVSWGVGSEKTYIGHVMGTPGYEQCLTNPEEQREIGRVKDNKEVLKAMPKILDILGYNHEKYKDRTGTGK
jgi:hypothetical protein